MKMRILVLFLIAVLMLAGCQTAGATARSAVDTVAEDIQPAGETLSRAAEPTVSPETRPAATPGATTAAAITPQEAQEIALKHAGFTADQVTRLYVQYDVDRGIPEYDVEFHEGRWEYDYEIHAETGEILSFEKDD